MSLARGVFRTAAGRLRLGWRLLLFALMAVGGAVALGAALPGTVHAAGAALLAGSLLAGWTLLAFEGRSAGELGFHLRGSLVRDAFLGLGLGVIVALAAVALIMLAGGVTWRAEGGTPAAYARATVAALGLYVLPAAGEEAFFRGYPLLASAEVLGRGPALIATSVLFGVLHLWNPGAGWIGAVNVAAAGCLLGGLLLRTRSLWWASGAHLGWNFAHGFLADLPVSGLDLVDAPYVAAQPAGAAWLSGGAFGPEGSLATTVVALAAAAWVWWTPVLGPAGRRAPGVET